MDSTQKRAAEQDIRDLIVAYVHHLDHGIFDQVAKLYAPDGIMVRGGGEHKGHAKIVEILSKRSPTQLGRHMVANTKVEFKDDKTADIVSYYVAFSHDSKQTPKLPAPLERPFSMGEWHDSVVLTAEGWRFTRRETKRLFERPEGH